VSLINKMLQDLDRRNAIGGADGSVPPQQVRAVSRAGAGHEWFWRILAVLTLAAVGWVGWVAYQLQPRSLATELAFSAGEQARRKAPAVAKAPTVQKAESPALKSDAPAPKPAPAVQQAEAKPAPPPELFKLALAIDRPITARAARPAAKAAPKAENPSKAVFPEQVAGRVSKRELPMAPGNEAEIRFRQGVAVLNQGRIGDAEAHFKAALSRHPGHEASRQALIALMIEQRNLSEARRLLEDGLALNPAQTQFAAVLARVLVEGGDFAGAAKVLHGARNSAGNDADYQLLHGVVLQRLGRHAEAVDVLQRATQISDQQGATWVAMGVSYEAMGRRPEALQSYRRSLGAAPLAQEVRTYAEGRIRALN
jgi:MSHA biogenesis protein MshN